MVAFLCRYSTGATTTALFGTAVLSAICKRDKIQLDRDVILRSSAFLPRSICYSSTPPWWGYWDVRPDGFLHNFLRVARLLVTPYPLTHGGWVFYLSRAKDHWNDPPSTKALSSTITRLSTISITQVAPRGGCWYCYFGHNGIRTHTCIDFNGRRCKWWPRYALAIDGLLPLPIGLHGHIIE